MKKVFNVELIEGQPNGVTKLKVYEGKKHIATTVTTSKVDTVGKLASWLLAQRFSETEPLTEVQKQIVVDYSVEQKQDEFGNAYDDKIINTIEAFPLPNDKKRLDIKSLPGLGGTPEQAKQYAEGNGNRLPELIKNLYEAIAILVQDN